MPNLFIAVSSLIQIDSRNTAPIIHYLYDIHVNIDSLGFIVQNT